MKLLFDENLSHHLVESLKDLFPGSTHVRQLGLQSAEDQKIWEYAKSNQYCIVSKDDDFHQMSFVLGHPPKVIWLKLGNCQTMTVAQILRDCAERIESFLQNEEASFLVLTKETSPKAV